MASEETQTEERQENGHDARRTVVRAAAIAAASGATALAAKKALSSNDSSSEGDDDEQQSRRKKSSGGGDSMMSTMAGSAWNSARGTLMPMIEDAAGQAGEYLAKNGPEIVRDNIVPRFIRGFENARESSDDE
jgi:hypothetical protein